MTTRTRHKMTGEQRREQLLDAAKDVVSRDGVRAVSIEAVARAAGISRPIVYDHFDGLEPLLGELLERETARALAQLDLAAPPAGTAPGQALLGALRVYLEAVAADPVTWRLVLLPPDGLPAVMRALVEDGRETIRRSIETLAADGLGRPSPDPALTASVLQAGAEQAARLLLTDPTGFPVDRLLAHAAWLLQEPPA